MADDNKSLSVTPSLEKMARKRAAEDAIIREEGRQEGIREGRGQILEFLQHQYMDPGRPDRGSPEAQAILEVTRNIMRNFKNREDS